MIIERRDPGGWLLRWDTEIAANAIAEGHWPNKTVIDFALQQLAVHPDQIQFVDDGMEFTSVDLLDRARKLAGYFTSLGLRPGDVVAFQLPNGWEAMVISLAATMTGTVVSPIVPINRDSEVRLILNAAKARIMIIPPQFRGFDYVAMVGRIWAEAPALDTVLVTGGETYLEPFLSFDDVLETSSPILEPLTVDPNAVKLIMHTSGTTGRPKGVLHSHNTLFADANMMTSALGLGTGDRVFCPSPLTHITGFLWLLNMPWFGDIPAVTVANWDSSKSMELLQKYRCTVMLGATPFLQDLVRLAEERGAALPDLRQYVCGGAAVPPSLIYEAARRFPRCIPWRTFGSTETCTLTRGPRSRDDLRFGAETDGQLESAQFKLVSAIDSQPVSPGEEGELLVKTSSQCLGYANPVDNLGAYDEEGYFRMGDLGRIEAGDHFVCTGRKKDLIIRNGENISAKEIEDVLVSSPAIREVAVVSMPHPRTGEAICAFVVPAVGHEVDVAMITTLIAAAGLAKQKSPEHLEIVSDLPKTPAGKIRKDILRSLAANISDA
jgi:acyl-CoA synthetase (AMP-forming)/AMP-acid ligase II